MERYYRGVLTELVFILWAMVSHWQALKKKLVLLFTL